MHIYTIIVRRKIFTSSKAFSLSVESKPGGLTLFPGTSLKDEAEREIRHGDLDRIAALRKSKRTL